MKIVKYFFAILVIASFVFFLAMFPTGIFKTHPIITLYYNAILIGLCFYAVDDTEITLWGLALCIYGILLPFILIAQTALSLFGSLPIMVIIWVWKKYENLLLKKVLDN